MHVDWEMFQQLIWHAVIPWRLAILQALQTRVIDLSGQLGQQGLTRATGVQGKAVITWPLPREGALMRRHSRAGQVSVMEVQRLQSYVWLCTMAVEGVMDSSNSCWSRPTLVLLLRKHLSICTLAL